MTADPNAAEASPDAQSAILEARDVSVSFGRQPVLRGVDLSIPRGQTLAIIGESGCGKTVLLKTLIGLIRPTFGDVVFDGKSLSGLSDHDLTAVRLRYGFVFQNAALFDSLTIGDNVGFPLKQHTRKTPREIEAEALRRLAQVGLPDSVLPKKPAELSGGMRKRVGLARALILGPEVVLYDEPTTGLDPIMSDVINELILSVRASEPVTSVIVTHDMRTATKVADRVVMLYPLSRLADDEPQVLYDGPAAEIESSSDRRVAQFVRGEAGDRLMELRDSAR
jgi:phospholipid/cholesterol/gamma-HCH transport system ATP-binding protein